VRLQLIDELQEKGFQRGFQGVRMQDAGCIIVQILHPANQAKWEEHPEEPAVVS